MLKINLSNLPIENVKNSSLLSSYGVMFTGKMDGKRVEFTISLLIERGKGKRSELARLFICIGDRSFVGSKSGYGFEFPYNDICRDVFGDVLGVDHGRISQPDSILRMVAERLSIKKSYLEIYNSIPRRYLCNGKGEEFDIILNQLQVDTHNLLMGK